jgi:membrane protease YdiL (CAAX protease family)
MRQNNTAVPKPNYFTIRTANGVLLLLLCVYYAVEAAGLLLYLQTGYTIDPLVAALIQIIGCAALLIYVFLKADPVHALRLRPPKPANIGYSAALAFFIYLPMSALLAFIMESLLSAGVTVPANEVTQAVQSMPFWVEFAYFCAVIPLIEEMILRGVVQNAYERKTGMWAFVLSGVLFGVLHANLLGALNGAVVGLLMGYVYIRTRSLWCPILMHAVYNLFAFTSMPDLFVANLPWTLGLFGLETLTFRNTGYAVYTLGVAAIGVLMCYLIIRALNEKNRGNIAVKSPFYRPRPGQWALLVAACVLLAGRFIISLLGMFIV